ncbi:MAG: UDP-N-acetylmuramoyl-L-alanine--D-glutamate ligase [Bacteroidales bacterium]|nr:UDP-N-acetylmuramoyl-L-alanine--D-glutamate ligase [Bacteroidales bacterium]
MLDKLSKLVIGKRILILGFGREGQSTYKLLKKILPPESITIADKNPNIIKNKCLQFDRETKINAGANYLSGLNQFDLIIKSPGISGKLLNSVSVALTSQTDIFLQYYSGQTIGITGTKGKSTTSSLIHDILRNYFDDVILVGNIGVPPFDLLDKINPETKIVFELSSHQLENINIAPGISILLNIYQEHLDHFNSFNAYKRAKFNIVKFQDISDWFIYNADDREIKMLMEEISVPGRKIGYSNRKKEDVGAFRDMKDNIYFSFDDDHATFDFSKRKSLPGDHNLQNIMAAACASRILGVPDDVIIKTVTEFKGLKHRLEYLGQFKNIHFYNDSIATVPEAAIAAVNTLKTVDTIILGGKDRGIDYNALIAFLLKSDIQNVIYIGEAGKRICRELVVKNPDPPFKCFPVDHFDDIKEVISATTRPGTICLLSPAASSYDMFESFEERGKAFKKIAENL